MKDVTRIHIAKVTYDIELSAKKKLEAYIASLESYAQDADLLEDIEIRITELLSDRSVQQGGVITVDDVEAVCAQLGDPKEFMGDGEVVPEISDIRKRLYRNSDNALVAGVLSGVASYFGINPLWTRVVFIVIAFVSFGLAVLVYVLFWFIIPPARTAAEKLSMSGQPATLLSIRQLNELPTVPNEAPRIIKRVATIFLGLGSVLGALGVVAGLIYGVFALNQVSMGRSLTDAISESIGANYWVTMSLCAVAVSALVVLFVLVAYAAFKQVFNKKIWVTALVLIIVGLAAVGGTIGSAAYGSYDMATQYAKSITTRQIAAPAGLKNITELNVKNVDFNAQVRYLVDDNPRVEVVSPNVDKVSVTVDGKIATLHFERENKVQNYRYETQTYINIYGPALKVITADATNVEYEGGQHVDLRVTARNSAMVNVLRSQVGNLTLDLDTSSVSAESSTVSSVTVDSMISSTVSVGIVTSLQVKAPTTCPVDAQSQIYAAKVNDGFVTLNDARVGNTQYQDGCMVMLTAGDREIEDNDYRD